MWILSNWGRWVHNIVWYCSKVPGCAHCVLKLSVASYTPMYGALFIYIILCAFYISYKVLSFTDAPAFSGKLCSLALDVNDWMRRSAKMPITSQSKKCQNQPQLYTFLNQDIPTACILSVLSFIFVLHSVAVTPLQGQFMLFLRHPQSEQIYYV